MKLQINKYTGIFDIVASVIYFIAPFIGMSAAFGEAFGEVAEGSTSATATVVLLIALAGLVLHIVAFVKSKKAGISNTGNILGIIANAIYLLLGMLLAFPAMVLSILAAIFTLKQKPAK
ncbi:MAG: hypothetical protein RR789_08405 [Clostridium sp.]